ncbi:hypothetical protein BDW74DRAFT_173940 [Aspergillus multicolor]|uniref:uncharacterized protein n=1 Tax=Aspergillus multicolor TaxID=41759 RepID=UPI003CCCF2F9
MSLDLNIPVMGVYPSETMQIEGMTTTSLEREEYDPAAPEHALLARSNTNPPEPGEHPDPASTPAPETDNSTSEQTLLTRPNTPPAVSSRKQPKTPGRFARIIDTWFYEVLMMGFSIACFAAVSCLLFVTNGNTPPTLARGLTLNTIVSLLGTACKSSLIYVIGECIGQLKWPWYHKGPKAQQLDGIQLFDSASRGPLGSALILAQHRCHSLVSLGALVMLLALAFDSFMQQPITYPLREVQDDNSSSAAAPQALVLLPEFLGADTRSILYTGVWAEEPKSSFEVRPTCPSGNCTWPPFQSVGMCSHCEDVTHASRLSWDRTEINTTIPGTIKPRLTLGLPQSLQTSGLVVVDVQPDYASLLRLGFPRQTVWTPYYQAAGTRNATFLGVTDPLYVFTFVLKSATQCVLSLCARTYTVAVSNGVLTVDTSEPEYGAMFENPHWTNSSESPVPAESRFCWTPETAVGGSAVGPGITQITPSSFVGTPNGNASASAFCPTDTYCLYDYFSEERTQYNGSAAFTEWGESDVPQTYETFDNSTTGTIIKTPILDRIATVGLEAVVRNVAASFTKAGLTARGTTNHTNSTSHYTAAAMVPGTVRTAEVYVSVQWPWLIFPSALVAMAVVFLALTVLVNRRRGLRLWKSSVLALLFHGLEGLRWDDEVYSERLLTSSQMDLAAQDVKVKLEVLDRRRGFVLNCL